MKSIGEQHIKVYQFHFKYSFCFRLLSKIKVKKKLYYVYWYSWLGIGNHTVRWRDIQLSQVFKPTFPWDQQRLCKRALNKKFHHTYQILAVKWVRILSESVKKGKFVDKNHFFRWSSKNLWKLMLKLIKTERLKSKKDLVDGATYLTNFYKKYLQHLKRKEKMACISCHFSWFSSSYLFGYCDGDIFAWRLLFKIR